MPTSEIRDASGNYAGYARFDAAGNFQGTRGGYGTSTRGYRGENRGRGNNRSNSASAVQNAINIGGANIARRRRRARLR